jgi:hypothetical protein
MRSRRRRSRRGEGGGGQQLPSITSTWIKLGCSSE